MSESTVRYPELGDMGQGRPQYREGDEIVHPSGVRYRRVNGHWQIVAATPPEGSA